MKANIDRDGCISCGLCVNICPQAFRFAEDNLAEVFVDPIPPEAEDDAVTAEESCPVSVIHVDK